MLAGIIARVRSLWSGMQQDVDADMQAEFAHHIELRAADLVKSGLAPEEANRRARAEFGGAYNHMQGGRAARGLRWFDAFRISWLDMKLGARMVRRYPGLTLIGGVAMGVAIAIGAGVMGVIAMMKDPKIPLDEGERIVGIQVWGIRSNNSERRIGHDFAIWKRELRTVRDLGVFRNVLRAVAADDGRAEPGRGAEMSASGFRVARVTPLLGRYLIDEDERPDAPNVVVLGHEIWSGRFGSDSALVGKAVKIGGIPHIVVGVMPEDFAFPINHALWLPLRLDSLAEKPRQGPVLYAFGRLAPNVELGQAQAEIEALSDRMAKQLPETHTYLRTRVMSFSNSWFELDSPETQLAYRAAQLAVTLLLMIICVNIAILVYARTATRQGEIAVRSALGASRGRIVAQLFGEALVLSAVGAVVGLGIITLVASQARTIAIELGAAAVIPFWMRVGVLPATIGYLVGLAVLSAVIIGVLPALQVTGRRVQANLQRLSGGHASVRMGKVWTSLIVAEVACTVAILPSAAFLVSESLKAMMTGPGFPAEQYLSAEFSVNREQSESTRDVEDSAFTNRTMRLQAEVIRRLTELPEVAGVTFGGGIPGSESSTLIEIDGDPVRLETTVEDGTTRSRWGSNARRVRLGDVAANFFDVLDVTPIAGRTFTAGDAGPGAIAAVVNRTFADSIVVGGSPIGRRFRSLGMNDRGEHTRGMWHEIVGVVPNVPAHVDYERPKAVWYSPTRHLQPARLAIHVRGTDPATFTPKLREIAANVDPSIFLRYVQPLDEALWKTHLPLRVITTGLVAIAFSVLILSSAGLYALMSVIVTQRRREIGIRIALGADRRQVLSGIFSRAAMQIGSGVALGVAIAALVLHFTGAEMAGFNALLVLPGVSLFMLAVGALAALGPARRGLAIEPSVVLKED